MQLLAGFWLLSNQYKSDLKANVEKNNFDCQNQSHVIAEILYISANALSSQSLYKFSNFYLNLSKYLNPGFFSYNTLLAENFYNVENFKQAKKIYNDLGKESAAFNWYAAKQNSIILLKEDKTDKALKLLKNSYEKLKKKSVYEIIDYADFLKNNDQFKKSIIFYTELINKIESEHPLYPQAMDGRGIAYERIDEWDKAEKDLLASLDSSPDQAYVINYLAYSWIEKGIKVDQSLKMLKKANKLKPNDPYIIDSLGWALFKLKKYSKAKTYLQKAIQIMPADPVINDHFADSLWMNGNKLQARYYWNYVLNLEDTDKELREKISDKIVFGLKN